MTKQEWELLKEIRKIKKLNDEDQRKYWEKKFENLRFEEDINIRSRFKYLRENGFIQILWADNIPYSLVLTDLGTSYSRIREVIKSLTPYVIKWGFGILATIIATLILGKLTN